jgi:copper chaperone
MTMIEMTLPTMNCGHCVNAVTRAVQQVDPAAKVEVDLARKRVQIDSARDPAAFAAALAAEGYAPGVSATA